jgi:hypothetical protein
VRYQDVVGRLIFAADGAGLGIYGAEDRLELHEMSRSFRVLCVPDSWERPFDIRAQLQFHWSCEQAAYSIYGTQGVCALYHGPDQECTHDELEAEPMIELEIDYHLPDQAVAALTATTDMEYFGQRVREAHRECAEHENLVAVRFESVFYENQLRVSSAVASHYWLIEGEDLEHEEHLAPILADICTEVHDFLLRLAGLFTQPREKGRRRRRRAR